MDGTDLVVLNGPAGLMNGDFLLETGIISGISSRFRLPLDKISKISALEKIFSNNFLIFPIWKNFRSEICCISIGCC